MSLGRSAVQGGLAVTMLVLASCGLMAERVEPQATVLVAAKSAAWRGHTIDRPDALAVEFTQTQPRLRGQVGLAIMPVGGNRTTVFGDWTTGLAWSTIKVPLAVAALRRDPEGAMADAEAAITVSDNDAADALWDSLGDGLAAAEAVQQVLDEAGDATTGVPGPRTRLDYEAFGTTEWSLTDQVRFASRLPCLPQADAVTQLMGRITPDQGWGLGTIEGAIFKGGWGPDDETGVYLVRQFGLVPARNGLIAVSMAAQAESGDFTDATHLLDDMAALLARHLDQLRGGHCAH
ncbi:hypothetical protein IU436_18080 [Nocardia farcinica]|uniref:Serine hydrolase n=2 Tax=Nocardia farcinica TaxID=37329 RepID=A0A449H1T6_NOCFR|nr:hypothetical protein [Nocardia farcinica]MBF6253381.1 hypothetical protein [Nocardia farcinica]MBF6267039.1 hypothetical protein [Nocardia farcinica]MBF6295544.1 hypothetical protein [Nocardia farcinica]MBF6375732.1 hypothetical protein [Nocardia farcinica]MBF6380925.1 hypothetical protein [Nocardia farcinica]